jgi:phosphate transport system substrate-binding protein
MMRLPTFLRLCLLLALAAGFSTGLGCLNRDRKVRIEGSGSSSVAPLMGLWKNAYMKDKAVEINYQPVGSSTGVTSMMKTEVDFACSDESLNDVRMREVEELGGPVIHIPLCMGGIVPAYNIGVDVDLRFSGEVLVGIFQGDIKTWDDPRIKDLQSDEVKNRIPPGLEIAAVVRQDASGTTFIFTDYLNKVTVQVGGTPTKIWKGGKAATDIKWPGKVVAANKSAGVANAVKSTVGAISYVELTYARQALIKFGSVRNSTGRFLRADDLKTIVAAADSVVIPADLRYSITAAPGADAYPIAGTVWAICYTKQPVGRGKPLADFLTWVTSDEGQMLCQEFDYARLPDKIVQKVAGQIKQIEIK